MKDFLNDPYAALDRAVVWLRQVADAYGWHLLAAALTLTVLGDLIRLMIVRLRRARLARQARCVEILAPPEVEPSSAATLWSNLAGLLHPTWKRLLYGQPHVAFEYAWTAGRLRIHLWVPGVIPQHMVEQAIEAAWPGARTVVADPRSPIPADAVATGGALRLARPDHFPLRWDFDTDPLRPLLGAASGLAEGQHAAVQILARPVTGRRLGHAYLAAAHLRGIATTGTLGRILDLITPMKQVPSAPAVQHPERNEQVRAILAKATQTRYAVQIRYAAATTWTGDDQAARSWARGRAHAIASAFAAYTGHNHLERHRLRRPAAPLDQRRIRRGDLLSVSELAAVAHLPLDPAVPGLARAGARSVMPPPNVPPPGRDAKPLGDADTGPDRAIGLPITSARHHLQIIGATGVGKSTLLANLVLDDASAGRGVVVIDPKGDLVIDLLRRLPATAGDQLVLFDPDDHAQPPVLNVLGGHDADLATDNLVGIFRRIYADFWGPRTDDILRAACLTLGHLHGATLADVPRLLGEDHFRQAVLAQVHDEVLAGFWSWYTGLSTAHRAQVAGPLMNKLRAFLLRPYVRAIVGTPGPGLDLAALLDTGGIVLCRAPKGTLGTDTSRLLGSMLLAKVWEATTRRARRAEATRRDSTLIIDECHNFLTLPHGLEDMLAEARGYRLAMVLAHQNLSQLPRDIRDGLSANARNKVIFSVAPEDARPLARHTLPNLTDHDLAHLGAYQAAVRLLIAGDDTPAFTLATRPLAAPVRGRERGLRHAARARVSARASRTARPDPRRDGPAEPPPPSPEGD